MRTIVAITAVLVAVSSWGQSLGDVARADRARAKTPATKTLTDDDLKKDDSVKAGGESQSSAPDGLQDELEHMKNVFHQICSDPRTDHGGRLSDNDRQEIADAAKPLRERVQKFQDAGAQYKSELEGLNKKMEAEVKSALPSNRAPTDADTQKVKALQQKYDSQKVSLLDRAKSDLREYEGLQKQLEAVGNECPKAAQVVPD
jgi:hypothetical protein